MTLEILDKEIESKFASFSDVEEKKAYEFIKKYLEHTNLQSIIDFLESDTWDFLTCYYYLKEDNIKINDSELVMDRCRDFFSILDDKSIENIVSIFLLVKDCNEMSSLINFFSESSKADDFYLKKLGKIDRNLVRELSSLKMELKERNIDIVPIIKCFNKNSDLMCEMIAFFTIKREMEKRYDKTVIIMDGKGLTEREIEHKKNRIVSEFLSRDYKINNIKEKIDLVLNFVNEYEKKEKRNSKEIIAISNAREYLESELKKSAIYNYRDITKGIKDSKIKYMFLRIIKDHNEDYYNQLVEECDLLQQDEEVSIKALLNDYGIKNGISEISSIMRFSRKDLEEILKFISLLNISNEERVFILQNTDIEIIRFVKKCIEEKLFPTSFVSSNISMFSTSLEMLNVIRENILYLKEYDISVSIFMNSYNILLSDSGILRENIKLLKTYNLLNYFKDGIDYSFLLDDKLYLKIDKLLELGFEEFLEEDLSLLNSDELYRLDIMKTLNMPINTCEELHNILNSNREFFVTKKDALSYLPNTEELAKDYELSLCLNELDKYRVSDRLYDINGVKISYNKVIRGVNQGNSVFYAVIDNMFLEEGDLEKISKIRGKVLKKYINKN